MKTYELKIDFNKEKNSNIFLLKDEVKTLLNDLGETTFVEGVVDDIYIDFDYKRPDRDFYEELGGNGSPILLYSYDPFHLKTIRSNIEKVFFGRVECYESSMDTLEWQEGWKKNFLPIETDIFCIVPPWIYKNARPSDKIVLEIDPGMAFGTGQHATTQICLKAIEKIDQEYFAFRRRKKSELSFLDIGTGSGILAIALAKLGYENIIGTDIDEDSISSAKKNADANGVSVFLEKGTFPKKVLHSNHGLFDFIIANILPIVLREIIPGISENIRAGGEVVLSGILEAEERSIIDLCREYRLTFISRDVLNEWVCLRLQKV
ncbi:MAG: 50S ribosomal protein L11 methyltransferase [Oligoflexales bacterium]|nr:50S ribosomal protein L11 methyltransferase [Oligoflexales bacterium]